MPYKIQKKFRSILSLNPEKTPKMWENWPFQMFLGLFGILCFIKSMNLSKQSSKTLHTLTIQDLKQPCNVQFGPWLSFAIDKVQLVRPELSYDINNPNLIIILYHEDYNVHKQYNIQGVPQYCLHFCFVNFLASNALRSSILDIFQQPFQCRF